MKKRLLTILFAAVLLVCAVALVACGTPSNSQPPNENAIYYLFENGELNHNIRITLAVGNWTDGSASGAYTLDGTNIELKDANGQVFATGSVSNGMLSIVVDGEQKVYYTEAAFSGGDEPHKEEYLITFDSDGGTEVDSVRYSPNTPFSALPYSQREGYVFLGWRDIDGTVYSPDDLTPKRDLYLVARWEKLPDKPEGYRVGYALYTNGYEDRELKHSGSIDLKKVSDLVTIDIPTSAIGGVENVGNSGNFVLTATDHELVAPGAVQIQAELGFRTAWYADVDCTIPNSALSFTLNYGNNIQYVAVTRTNSTEVEEVVAINFYLAHDYTLSLYQSIKSDAPYDRITVSEREVVYADQLSPCNSVFQFDHFVYSYDGVDFSSFGDMQRISGDMKVYVIYKPAEMTLDLDGGTLEQSVSVVPYRDNELPVPVKDGYTFLGWALKDGTLFTDGEGKTQGIYLTDNNVFNKLYAKFALNRYYYTFSFENTPSGMIETTKLVPVAVCDENNVFTGTNYVHPDEEFNVELTEENTCFIGETFSVMPKLDGQTFVSWSVDGEVVSTKPDADFVMTDNFPDHFAEWEEYVLLCSVSDGTITVTINGVVSDLSKEGEFRASVTAGSIVEVTTAAKESGTSFAGWDTLDIPSPTVNSTTIRFEMPAEHCTVSGRWLQVFLNVECPQEGCYVSGASDHYTVKFDLNGAEGSVPDQDVYYQGKNYVLRRPDIPTWSAHVFTGWYLEPTCETRFEFTETISGPLTLYAGWMDVSKTLNIHYTATFKQLDCTINYNEAKHSYSMNIDNNDDYCVFYCDTDLDLRLKYRGSKIVVGTSNSGSFDASVGVLVKNLTKGTEIADRYTPDGTINIHGDKGDVIAVRFYSYTGGAMFVYYDFSGMQYVASTAHYVPSKESVAVGASVTVYASGGTNKVFVGWLLPEKVADTLRYDFTMPDHDVNLRAYWATLLFETNGDNVTLSDQPSNLKVGDKFTITATLAENSTFVGWYCDGKLYSNSLTITVTAEELDRTYIAKAYPTLIQVEKNIPDAGTVSNVPSRTMVGEEIDLVATTNEGYMFSGWYIANELICAEATLHFTVPSDNVEIVAKWNILPELTIATEAGSATVSFDANGKNLNIPSQVVTESDGLVYPKPESFYLYEQQDDKVFTGWYSEPECKNLFDFTSTVGVDTTLYAGWTVISGAGTARAAQLGTGSTYNAEKRYNFSLTSSSAYKYVYIVAVVDGTITINHRSVQSPTRYYSVSTKNRTTGKSFPFAENTYGTTVNVDVHVGDIVELCFTNHNIKTGSVDIGIFVDGNEPVAGGTYSAGIVHGSTHRKVPAGAQETLTVETRPGFSFVGWFLGENKVSSELSIEITMPDQDVTYTVKWIKCPITVVNSNEEQGTVTVPETSVVGGDYLMVATPIAPYSFGGWYIDSQLISTQSEYAAWVWDDVTYTAKWVLNTVTVSGEHSELDLGSVTLSFDANGQESPMPESQTVTVGQGMTIPTMTPGAEGMNFTGWYKDADCTEPFDFTATISRDTVAYAGWKQLTGTGYYAMDMFLNNSEATARELTAGKTISGSRKLVFTAVAAGTYRIHLACTTSNTVYYRIYPYNGNTIEDSAVYTTKFNASKSFEVAAGTIILVDVYNGNANLGVRCYVEYVGDLPQGGNFGYESAPVQAGEEFVFTAAPAEGYKFVGWFENGTLISDETTLNYTMPNKEVELVAQSAIFAHLKVTVAETSKGEATLHDEDVREGAEVRLVATTYEGYVFDGWYANGEKVSSNSTYTFSMPTEDLDIVAKWK